MRNLGIVGSSNFLATDAAMPITEIITIGIADVDNLAYFSGSVGQKKRINYYDVNYKLLYSDVFEYDSSAPSQVKIIKRVQKDFYKGLYDASTGVEPASTKEGSYFYIEIPGTINNISFVKKDVLMYIKGKWTKGIYRPSDNSWEA